MNDTATINTEQLTAGFTRGGPWRSTYRVNAETLAVNLACSGNAELDDGGSIPDAVTRGAEALIASAGDGSINGFWGTWLLRLDGRSYELVADRAIELLRAHRAASFGSSADLYEMFDGQER